MSIASKTAGDKSAVSSTKGYKSHGNNALSVLRSLEPRTALVEQVVERMREGIFGGEFPPGTELPSEGKLATAIGVSYTVMREAMRSLRALGLVEVSHGRRPRVKPAGPDAVREALDAMLRRSSTSLRELTELRKPLECEIVALASQRATPEDLERLEGAIARQAAAKTLEAQIAADIDFHDLLALAAGNSLFVLVLSSVSGLLWESRRQTIQRVGTERAIRDHCAVLNAVRLRDPVAARQAMVKHMQTILEDLSAKQE
jgi:DNA-binding FadR family transcriptional regulator